MSHIHCPRCSYEIEVPKQSTVARPGFWCDQCGKEGKPLTWEGLSQLIHEETHGMWVPA